MDWEIIFQGTKSSFSINFLQHSIFLSAGIVLPAEYTNTVTELADKAINNIADFLSGINGCFVQFNENKSKKLQH